MSWNTSEHVGMSTLKRHAFHAKGHFNLVWNLSKREVFQLPPKARRRHQKTTRHVGSPKRAFLTRLPPIFTLGINRRFPTSFPNEPQNWRPQNRCFVRGFRQFSLLLTKCRACPAICALSPLDAALTLRFAKTRNTTLPIPVPIYWHGHTVLARLRTVAQRPANTPVKREPLLGYAVG